MSTAIYVIVRVSHDYYRFQDNIGAFTNFDEARRFAEQKAAIANQPVILNDAESMALDDSETDHIWIDKFEEEKP